MKKILEVIGKFFEKVLSFLENLLRSVLKFIGVIILFIFKYPLVFSLIIIIICFIISTLKDIYLKRKCIETEFVVRNKFGYTIYLTAPIRTGKTTLMSGLSHILTNVLIRLASNTIAKTKKIIIDIDYLEFDSFIKNCYSNKVAINECIEQSIENFSTSLNGSFEDPINRSIEYQTLIKQYVKASYALLTNNYVFASKETPFYNRITGTYRKKFDFKSMQLKEAYDNDLFMLSNYNIILEDEKGLDGKKKENKYMSSAAEDDGMPEFLRLIGNAGEETIYYITTNQNAKRWVTTERQLMTSSVLINGFRIHFKYSFYRKFLRLVNNIVNFFYRISIFFHFNQIKKSVYLSRFNRFKKMNRKLYLLDQKLFSKSVIEYKVSLYDNVENVGKKNTANAVYCEDLSLFIPLVYCFGNIDTHLYSFIFDILNENSKVDLFSSSADDGLMSDEEKQIVVENLLKRKKKNDEKESDSSSSEEESMINIKADDLSKD